MQARRIDVKSIDWTSSSAGWLKPEPQLAGFVVVEKVVAQILLHHDILLL